MPSFGEFAQVLAQVRDSVFTGAVRWMRAQEPNRPGDSAGARYRMSAVRRSCRRG